VALPEDPIAFGGYFDGPISFGGTARCLKLGP
jgi:hypothetical protein